MKKELLRKLQTLISSSLIVSNNLLLSACDDKVQQQKSNKSGEMIEPLASVVENKTQHEKFVSEPEVQVENINIKKVSTSRVPSVKVKKYKQSRVSSISTEPKEGLSAEEDKPEIIILDLSLNLELDGKYYNLQGFNKKRFSGIFEFEEDVLNFEMETHFEWPHNENKEQEAAPDGVGVGIKVGI